MTIPAINPPFPFFVTQKGAPLEAGYIYIGEAGYEARSRPKASFWDAAGLIPTGTAAGNPVRTTGGLPSYAGAAARLHVNGDYSITVLNSARVLVYSALSSDQASLDSPLAFDTVAELLSDTSLGYAAPALVSVAAGQYLLAGGHRYQVAASGASDHHVTTAGGVKCYVMPVGSDFQAAAFGITGVDPAGTPFDERAKIATAFRAAGNIAGETNGISIVHFDPDRIYGITNLARLDCPLPAGVGFDLHGSMITRVGGIITVPMIENANTGIVGGTPTRDHHIRNGKLRGTGAPGAVSDQGSALLLFESDGTSFITNIETIDTNGDGLAFRNATVVMKDVVIGDFGRNGISPTSGDFVYDNVRVIGTAISGANPGIGIDAENNSSSEFGRHVMYYVEAPDITFVDFWASSGTEFRHEVEIYAGKIGETYRGLRFLSQNPTVANKVTIHEGVLIGAGGVGGAAVWIDNVSGIRMVGPTLDVGSATGSMNAISLEGTITSLILHGVEQTGAFSSFIISTAVTALSGIEMLGCGVTSRLYLHNCTGSYFSDGEASNVTLSGATTGNIFSPTFRVRVGAYTLVGGATKEAQRIGYMLTEAEIDGEYGLTGPVLRMRGRRSFSSHGLGEIVGFSNEPGSETSGASVKFSGSNLTEGIIDFYTCTTGPRVNRMRIAANGGVLMYALPVYADDAAAGVGGLVAGALYRTATGEVRVKT